MTYIKKIYDALTGEETIVPMTAEEIAINETETNRQLALMAEREASEAIKAAAKSALLAKLGITEDEAKLLLS